MSFVSFKSPYTSTDTIGCIVREFEKLHPKLVGISPTNQSPFNNQGPFLIVFDQADAQLQFHSFRERCGA